MEEDSFSDDSDAAEDPSRNARLYSAVCEVFAITRAARDVCRDGLLLMNRLYACGYREPALLIRDWLQRADNTDIAPAMVIAKVTGLHFAFDLLLNVSVTWSKSIGDTALHRTVKTNNAEMLRLLVDIEKAKRGKLIKEEGPVFVWVDLRNSEGMTPLHIAAAFGAFECMELLVAYGVHVNGTNSRSATALHLCVQRHLPPGSHLFQMPLEDLPEGYKVMYDDVQLKQADCVRVLLKAGADVNALDQNMDTPAHWAARYGCPRALSVLLDSGADVNILNRYCETALHAAVHSYNHIDVSFQLEAMQLLIKVGVNLEERDHEQRTALHIALEKGKPDHLKLLVKAGADVNVLNAQGETPLQWLSRNASILKLQNQHYDWAKKVKKCVCVLVRAGADTRCIDCRFLKDVLWDWSIPWC